MTNNNKNDEHRAVLAEEVLKAFKPQTGETYLDATFGRGGHSQTLLERGARVIAFDFDQESIKEAQKNFSQELAGQKLLLFRKNFTKMAATITNLQKSTDCQIKGILFDFGTSSNQLMSTTRGFSFTAQDETLDMRMDDRLGVRACDLLKLLDERQLSEMFWQYGGETDAKAIAKEVVTLRRQDPKQLEKVGTLVQIIEKVKGHNHSHKLHPATKTFQALRIIVNDELNNIKEALPMAVKVLQDSKALDKKIVCISFHEGEDRLVKTYFKEVQSNNLGKIINKKAIQASAQEMINNPRSRSAKMRILAV